jgi:hypothetical protein
LIHPPVPRRQMENAHKVCPFRTKRKSTGINSMCDNVEHIFKNSC